VSPLTAAALATTILHSPSPKKPVLFFGEGPGVASYSLRLHLPRNNPLPQLLQLGFDLIRDLILKCMERRQTTQPFSKLQICCPPVNVPLATASIAQNTGLSRCFTTLVSVMDAYSEKSFAQSWSTPINSTPSGTEALLHWLPAYSLHPATGKMMSVPLDIKSCVVA
jgi:hypothetical protein